MENTPCKYINKYLNLQKHHGDKMLVANFSEFRTGLKKYLDEVENNDETLIVKRNGGKGAVVISLSEYNSIMETAYLLGNRANRRHLEESIDQMHSGKVHELNLSDIE